MADGIYYRDSRQPFVIADQAAVTLLSTDLNLFPKELTLFPANYWTVGKTIKLTAWGKMTTAATPGNLVVGIGIGPQLNPPTIVKKSAAKALQATQTDQSWRFEAYCTCRTVGTAGANSTMMMYGEFKTTVTTLLSTVNPVLIPDSANTAVSFDATIANNLTLIANRSGSTAETMATQGLYVEALN